jgi:hypothetical protein
MDCEKFDNHLIDALYDELDEVTLAAMRRHADGCARCAGAWSGLRATRKVAVLPLLEPSDGLEDRILSAVASAQRTTPWHRKALRGLAWAGSHAMRPQLAMAALFFLVIGSSMLLLRARPGSMAVAPVRVTERGTPAADPVAQAGAAPAPAAPAATAVAAADVDKEKDGLLGGASGAKGDAKERARADEGDGQGADPARQALKDARGVRDQSGCSAAVKAFDAVGAKFPGTSAAADAMWDEAACYKSMGDGARARELWAALRQTSYGGRAEQELLAENNSNQLGNQSPARVASKAPAATAPPPVAAADAKPGEVAAAPTAAASARATSAGKAQAAPAPAKKAKSDEAYVIPLAEPADR